MLARTNNLKDARFSNDPQSVDRLTAKEISLMQSSASRNILNWSSEETQAFDSFATNAKQKQKDDLARQLQDQIENRKRAKALEQKRINDRDLQEDDVVRKQQQELLDQYKSEIGQKVETPAQLNEKIETPKEPLEETIQRNDQSIPYSNFNFYAAQNRQYVRPNFNQNNTRASENRIQAQVGQLDAIMKEIQQESTTAQKQRIETQMDLERMKQEFRMKNSLSQSRFMTFTQPQQQFGFNPFQPQIQNPYQPLMQQTVPGPYLSQAFDGTNNRPLSSAGFSIIKNRSPVVTRKSVEIKNELQQLSDLIASDLKIHTETKLRLPPRSIEELDAEKISLTPTPPSKAHSKSPTYDMELNKIDQQRRELTFPFKSGEVVGDDIPEHDDFPMQVDSFRDRTSPIQDDVLQEIEEEDEDDVIQDPVLQEIAEEEESDQVQDQEQDLAEDDEVDLLGNPVPQEAAEDEEDAKQEKEEELQNE